jgi:2-oxoglutarate dehydrogenase E2 component (dihydrolipoamide succinyltransferase)
VKTDENVTIGHVVATIVEGAAAGKAEGRPPKPASPQQGERPPPPPTPAPPAAEQQPAAPLPPPQQLQQAAPQPSSGRARISFPPRRTPSGEIISEMPAEQAAAAALRSAGAGAAEAAPPAEQLFLMRMRAAAAARGPLVPRRALSEWEMEKIMRGGCDP